MCFYCVLVQIHSHKRWNICHWKRLQRVFFKYVYSLKQMKVYIRDLKIISNLLLKMHKRTAMFCSNDVQAAKEIFASNKCSAFSISAMSLVLMYPVAPSCYTFLFCTAVLSLCLPLCKVVFPFTIWWFHYTEPCFHLLYVILRSYGVAICRVVSLVSLSFWCKSSVYGSCLLTDIYI